MFATGKVSVPEPSFVTPSTFAPEFGFAMTLAYVKFPVESLLVSKPMAEPLLKPPVAVPKAINAWMSAAVNSPEPLDPPVVSTLNAAVAPELTTKFAAVQLAWLLL